MIARIAFRAILVIVGAVSTVVALNVAFGGIHTLGWQGTPDFFTVTDDTAFLLRDGHARFFGGTFLVLGLFLIVASFDVTRFRGGLYLAFAMMFAGGLARFTELAPQVMFGPDVLLSTTVELVLMPVLFVWLWRSVRLARVPEGVASR